MPYPSPVTLLTSAVRTASGVGAAVDLRPVTTPATPPRTTLVLDLVVSAVAGADPTLDVVVQTSADGANWRDAWPFALTTAPTSVQKRICALDRYVRAAWTLGGAGAAFTFALGGEALVVMATPAHIAQFALNPSALRGVSLETQDVALEAATTRALGILGRRYKLPMITWSTDVSMYIAQIAAPTVMMGRGLGPEDAKVLFDQRKEALAALDTVGSETVDPQAMLADSSAGVYDAGAFVSSKPRRGW